MEIFCPVNVDHQLYGRACGWAWFIWSSVPGKSLVCRHSSIGLQADLGLDLFK